MKLDAHAKVNLFLRITGRRPDGYHLLRTVFWPVSLYDTIEIERTGTPGIRLSCSDPSLENENNLALKAVHALRSAAAGTADGLLIRIEKRIPMGAGLGGGSADAAAVLRGVNDLCGLGLSDEELRGIGAKIGADVPCLLCGRPCIGEGIGDVLSPLMHFPKLPMAFWKPAESYSTPEMYRRLDLLPEKDRPDPSMEEEKERRLLSGLVSGNVSEIAAGLYNVFEAVVPDPEALRRRKMLMLEAGFSGALMTGSGSALFGIAENEAALSSAAGRLTRLAGGDGTVLWQPETLAEMSGKKGGCS